MRESADTFPRKSNRQGGKNAPKNICAPEERIFFRDLARVAFKRKVVQALSEHLGTDESTAKRWLSNRSRAPDRAVTFVLGEIMRRYG